MPPANERQYDQIESVWKEMVDLAPDHINFYIGISDRLNEIKHHQRAAGLLFTVLASAEEKENWRGCYTVLAENIGIYPAR